MNNDIKKIMAFYEKNRADIVSGCDCEGEGVLFTLPPCSPEALRRAVRQLRRAGATKMRWIRRVRLQSRLQGDIEAFSIVILPEMAQNIYRLDTGEEIPCRLLNDESFTVAKDEISAGSAKSLP